MQIVDTSFIKDIKKKEIIGNGKNSTVYRYEDNAIKVFRKKDANSI